jgi:hypothetical protein
LGLQRYSFKDKLKIKFDFLSPKVGKIRKFGKNCALLREKLNVKEDFELNLQIQVRVKISEIL